MFYKTSLLLIKYAYGVHHNIHAIITYHPHVGHGASPWISPDKRNYYQSYINPLKISIQEPPATYVLFFFHYRYTLNSIITIPRVNSYLIHMLGSDNICRGNLIWKIKAIKYDRLTKTFNLLEKKYLTCDKILYNSYEEA